MAPESSTAQRGKILVGEADPSLCYRGEAGQAAKKGGFSRARTTDDGDKLSGGESHTDIPKGLKIAKALGDVIDGQDR
jgi:hypothetical protein